MTEVHNATSSLKLCKEQGRIYLVKVKVTMFNSSKRMWYCTELKKSCQLGAVHASSHVFKARVEVLMEDKSTESLRVTNTDTAILAFCNSFCAEIFPGEILTKNLIHQMATWCMSQKKRRQYQDWTAF